MARLSLLIKIIGVTTTLTFSNLLMVFSFTQTEVTVEKGPIILKGKENPFLTSDEEKLFQEQGTAIPLDGFNITAIIYAPDAGKSCVIVNGRILKIGDYVDNKEITNIKPEEIRLKDSVGEYVIKVSSILKSQSQEENNKN
ncbi:MAG: general secretion pathway protein GspB [Candidatus Omnitrophica bacterium]|nr:general secretion pathway protein GspB [Candidatus Omnitrophota bacterium]